ncbi:unnamed protein product, partial [Ixodes hexagonus]
MRELHAKKCRISTVSRQAFQPFTHLRRVDLSDNEISSLSNSTFPRNSELVAFSAASNSLKNIDIVFSNARWLKYLDLNNNYIEDITKALAQLSTLSKLKLKLNRIRFIRDETFIFNKNLEQLDLRQNKIEWLGANCFKGLLRLDFLDLRNNKLLALNGSTSNLPALRVIYLNENTLRVLEEKDFRNNPELRIIYASGNNITSLERSFRNLDNLRTVWLQGNRLTAVHRKSFPEAARTLTTTPKLSFLDLSRNLLSKIEPSMIPKYVQALNIEGNKFSRFPLALVASLNLSSIQLAENPWRCDCEDYPFSKW